MTPNKYSKCIYTAAGASSQHSVLPIIYIFVTLAPGVLAVSGNYSDESLVLYVLSAALLFIAEYYSVLCHPVFGADTGSDRNNFYPAQDKITVMASCLPVNRKTILASFWNIRAAAAGAFALSNIILGIRFLRNDITVSGGVCGVGITVIHIYFWLMSELFSKWGGVYGKKAVQIVGILPLCFSASSAAILSAPEIHSRQQSGSLGVYIIIISIITLVNFFLCRRRSLKETENMTVSGEKICK